MKRIMSLLMVFSLLLSGCGGGEPEEAVKATAAAAEDSVPEATRTPTTEPTLSPEEVLYNSLPDRMKQAVDVGILELSQLEDMDRIVTVGEASAMLQRAYVHRTGVESKTLAELMVSEKFAAQNAIRGWLSIVPAMTDLELVHGDRYESYEQWQQFMATGFDKTEPIWYIFPNRLNTASADYMRKLNMADEPQVLEQVQEDPLFVALMTGVPRYCPIPDIYPYSFSVFDATNGKKFMTADENGLFNALGELTVAELVESALCFYNYPNPMAIPEFLAPEEMGGYNPEIITSDLLSKETDLPAASCQKLPSEWHGVVMDDMDWLGQYTHLDGNVYEYEIKAIKDAGFNFIGFNLDFNWLQDYWLFGDKAKTFADYVDTGDKGKLSLERLEQLDQILAWCMKYDIHLNLRCTGVGYFDNSHNQNVAMRSGTGPAKKLAKLWQAIAVRYTDIPNAYLSFTVLSNPVFSYADSVQEPSVRAIQEVSPDRCLMVEVGNWTNKKPENLAKLGVALSYRVGEPYAALEHKEYFKYNRAKWVNEFTGQDFVDSFLWPHGDFDGEAVMTTGLWGCPSIEKTAAVAEEYGVGFMVGDFGVNLENAGADRQWPARRYPDEAYKAMIGDVVSAMESRSYGWCFAHWYGYFGIANGWPAFENATYQQLEDYPYYIDTAMLSWFREVNGVA